jgi:predicted transcriptional regulator
MKTKTLFVRLKEKSHQKLQEIAKRDDENMSEVARTGIEKEIARRLKETVISNVFES